MGRKIIAVTINGSNVKAACFEDGRIAARSVFKGKGRHSYEALESVVFEHIGSMFTAEVDAIGISLSAVVDPFLSRCVSATDELSGFMSADIVRAVTEKFNCRTVMLSETHAALLGEMLHGVGKGYNSAAILNIEEGIGSAFFAFDNIVFGEKFTYGDIAHREMKPNGRVCSCGKAGCFEAYLGGTALDALAASNGVKATNRAQIFEKFQNQDMGALDTLDEYTQNLVHALKVIRKNLDANVYILSGGLNSCLDAVMPKLKKALDAELLLSVLGADAAIYGAYEWAVKL
jgi:glucokinase